MIKANISCQAKANICQRHSTISLIANLIVLYRLFECLNGENAIKLIIFFC